MYLTGSRGQQVRDFEFVADGSITTGGVPQLLLAERKSMSYLYFQNTHISATLYLEFGSARATATLTSGAVTSCTITNGGFGFTVPPNIEFLGGGQSIDFNTSVNTAFVGTGTPGYPAPHGQVGTGTYARPAKAHAVLTGGVVTSIVIDDPGAGYVAAPYVWMRDSQLDPNGCASPFYGSVNSGMQLGPGQSFYRNGTTCSTDPIAVNSSTTGATFMCRWMQ